jgi:hypothetical protein
MGLMCHLSRKNIILWTYFWAGSFLRKVDGGGKARIDTEEISPDDGEWFVLVHMKVLLVVVLTVHGE